MKKISNTSLTERPKVSVTECRMLVADGQSKKLADIRKRHQPDFPVDVRQHSGIPSKQLLTGLKPEVETELNNARKLIDDRISQIMRSFPEGKKNRLFSFRFGSVDTVKAMPIKTAFKTLGIDGNLVKMKLIAEMELTYMDAGKRRELEQ